MYYHGSPKGDIKQLKPHRSLHEQEYLYFSTSRVQALLYSVSCNFYPYGFSKTDGRVEYTEYFSDYIKTLYENKVGYIYSKEKVQGLKEVPGIKNAYFTKERIDCDTPVRIENVYNEFLKHEKSGDLIIKSYETLTPEEKEKISSQIIKEIEDNKLHENCDYEYARFIMLNFPVEWNKTI